MNCEANREGLSALLDGEATYEQELYLALHLERCADCQGTLAILGATRDLVRNSRGPALARSAGGLLAVRGEG